MLRAAKFVDVPRLVELAQEMHAASRYVGRIAVNEELAHKAFAALVQRHNGSHAGGTLVNVAEHDGVVTGFMAGLLDPVYHFGDKLAAKDAYLYVGPSPTRSADLNALLDAYIAWAEGNPKVMDINLSWTNAVDGAERIAKLYRRKGFHMTGEIYERAAR